MELLNHHLTFVFDMRTGASRVFLGEVQVGLVSRCSFVANADEGPQGRVEIHFLQGISPSVYRYLGQDLQGKLEAQVSHLALFPRVDITSPLFSSPNFEEAPQNPTGAPRFDREEVL